MVMDIRDKLQALEHLIEQERNYAMTLRIDDLKAIQQDKGQLLAELNACRDSCPDELKRVAKRLRDGNRRNARLLHAALTLLRQTMASCRNAVTPFTYGRQGQKVPFGDTGLLHIGKV